MDPPGMNAPVQGASGDALATLVIRGHYRLPDKPQRTLEALRVFFPRDAGRIFTQLRSTPVAVRRGEPASVRALAMSLRAQGFDVEVRMVEEQDTDSR